MISLLNWWYARGWMGLLRHSRQRLSNLADFFSIGLLAKTLFTPFRQISAGTNQNAPLEVRLRMFFDRLVSRLIGAIARSFIIVAGLVCILLASIFSLIIIILWPIFPFSVVIGLVLTITGVTI